MNVKELVSWKYLINFLFSEVVVVIKVVSLVFDKFFEEVKKNVFKLGNVEDLFEEF